MNMNRRRFVAGAGLLGLAAAAAPALAYEDKWPKKPAVPTDFNAEEFFVEYDKKGVGVTFGKADADRVAYIAFDTQCPWCRVLYEELKPLFGEMKFVFFPCAELSPWSEPQGAYILAAKDRAARFEEHEQHFKDEGFRGLDVRSPEAQKEITFELRSDVWTNSKIFRRAGARVIPFGVLRMPDGTYKAFGNKKTDEFRKFAGL